MAGTLVPGAPGPPSPARSGPAVHPLRRIWDLDSHHHLAQVAAAVRRRNPYLQEEQKTVTYDTKIEPKRVAASLSSLVPSPAEAKF